MDNEKLKKWKTLANTILEASRDFMNSGNEKFARGIIGELLTFSRLISTYENDLLSSNNNEIVYLGSSRKGLDINLLLNGNKIEINSKGTTEYDKNGKPKWVRQHARNFCTFSDNQDGTNTISPITNYKDDFFYIYVDIKKWLQTAGADFFVLSDEEAKKIFGKKYIYGNNSVRKHLKEKMILMICG